MMKKLLLSLTAIPLTSLVLSGQEAQSWTGLLVASGCRPIESTGSREQNSTYEQAQNQAAGGSSKDSGQMVRTTDRGTPVGATSSKVTSKPDPAKMDASCRIGQHTLAFALQLDDGKLLRFDEASNSKIVQQLQPQNWLQPKTKIFRTKVKGVLQNGTISVDSIEI